MNAKVHTQIRFCPRRKESGQACVIADTLCAVERRVHKCAGMCLALGGLTESGKNEIRGKHNVGPTVLVGLLQHEVDPEKGRSNRKVDEPKRVVAKKAEKVKSVTPAATQKAEKVKSSTEGKKAALRSNPPPPSATLRPALRNRTAEKETERGVANLKNTDRDEKRAAALKMLAEKAAFGLGRHTADVVRDAICKHVKPDKDGVYVFTAGTLCKHVPVHRRSIPRALYYMDEGGNADVVNVRGKWAVKFK